MKTYTAICERAPDGTWTATIHTPTVVFGAGNTMEGALEDLKSGMALWIENAKETGQEILEDQFEVASVEIIVPFKQA
jgi:predicted RNase H-like HicB family nuclease